MFMDNVESAKKGMKAKEVGHKKQGSDTVLDRCSVFPSIETLQSNPPTLRFADSISPPTAVPRKTGTGTSVKHGQWMTEEKGTIDKRPDE
jgi:hypothetical protein